MSACLLARAKLAQYVAKLKESSFTEKTGTAIKAGYLASAKTIMRNDLGNAAFGGVEYLAARPLAVALDYLHSTLKSAATFGKVQPHEFRQIANTLSVGGLARGAKGIREGVAQAVQLLRTGIDPERIADKFEVNETTFGSPVMDRAVHGVFNLMEANDKPFFQFALQTSLYGRARLMGIREGLTGSKLSARTNELLAQPTEEMVMGAMADAEYATFKNATALSDAAAGLRTGIRQKANRAPAGRRLGYNALQLGLDVSVPFTKVASAIANASVDYSPFGYVKALIQLADKDPKIEGQFQRQLARGTLGSGLVLLGYTLASQGKVQASSVPTGSARARSDLEGRQPNSVNMDGNWRSVTFLGPLAIPFLMGAGLYEFAHSKDDTGPVARGAFALGALGKTMTEQSYLQGLSGLIDALNDPANRGASAVAGMVPIPAIVSQTATALDPLQRQSEGVAQKLEAKLPLVSRRLAPRLTQFGDTVRKTSGGVGGALTSYLDITNPHPDRADGVTQELARLGASVPSFGRALQLPGTGSVKRTPEQYNALLSEFGPLKRQMLEALIGSPEYQAASDDERKAALETVLRQVQQTGTDVDKARMLGTPVPRVTLPQMLGSGQ